MMATGQDLQDFWRSLKDLGLGPGENVRRVIIDIPCDELVRVYYECFADERMFELDITKAMQGAEVVSVSAAVKRMSSEP